MCDFQIVRNRVWGRHAPTRALQKRGSIAEVQSRMGKKFSRMDNLWPRDGSCPLRFPELRWSVPHWLLAPGSEVLLSGRFSTLPTLLRIFMLMMREIGERVLCGKRWNSVSLCCKRFEGSAAVDNAPPQTTLLSFERKSLFFICNLFKIPTKKLHFYPVQ